MEELEIIREKIDEIDMRIQELFLLRMKWVRRVADIKKTQGIPILDRDRETAIRDQRLNSFSDREIRPYYEQLLQTIITLSKAYQEDRIYRRQG